MIQADLLDVSVFIFCFKRIYSVGQRVLVECFQVLAIGRSILEKKVSVEDVLLESPLFILFIFVITSYFYVLLMSKVLSKNCKTP